ncbi:hypothetical protein BZG19_05090 [Salinivibrio kushneri]|nr:hypothetical protein BZG19_05090 [Salinivibrio kushneri]
MHTFAKEQYPLEVRNYIGNSQLGRTSAYIGFGKSRMRTNTMLGSFLKLIIEKYGFIPIWM